jgi:CheY-like chemotaxis protein
MGVESRNTTGALPSWLGTSASHALAQGAHYSGLDAAAVPQPETSPLVEPGPGEDMEAQDTVPTHDLDLIARQTLQSVLMLEDDDAFGDIIRDSLGSSGYLVSVVRNGAEGLRRIVEEEVDIFLCDMVMPHFPGDMFYFAVSRIKPHLCNRFVFMTGHRHDAKIEKFIREVGGTILYKPFPLHELMERFQVIRRGC